MYYDFLLCFDIVSANRNMSWGSSWSPPISAHGGGKQVELFFSPPQESFLHLPGLGLLWWCGEFAHLDTLAKKVKFLARVPLVDPKALLVQAWTNLGTQGLRAHLEGPAAWGVVEEDGTAFIVRDPMGRVPVSYAWAQGRWAISSRPSAPPIALGLGLSPRATVARGICQGHPPTLEHDLFEQTWRLLPHHVLFIGAQGHGHTEPSWSPTLSPLPPSPTLAHEYLERLRHEAQLPDSHTTLMLSAGLDSVTLGALLGESLGGAASMTFGRWPAADESGWLDSIQTALGLPVVRLDMSGTWALRKPDMLDIAPDLGPLLHPGNTYEHEFLSHISALHPQGTRFVSGLGADEMLLAPLIPYLRHLSLSDPARLPPFARLWPRGQRSHTLDAYRLLAGLLGHDVLATLRLLRATLWPQGPTTPFSPAHWMSAQTPPDPGPAIAEQALLEQGEFGAWRLGQMRQWPWELNMRGIRRQERLLGHQLIYPYLGKALWEFALRLPPEALWSVKKNRPLSKQIARDAARLLPTFPPTLIDRPKTTTFAAPVDFGLAVKEVDTLRALAKAPCLHRLGLVNPDKLTERTDHYVHTVLKTFPRPHGLATSPLWRTLAVEHWLSLLL